MTGSTGCTSPNSHSDPDHNQWFDDVRWSNRLLVISGPQQDSETQLRLLREHADGLLERDLLVINTIPTDASVIVGRATGVPSSARFHERFALPNDAFCIALVGKDGRVKERRTDIFNPNEIFAIIDAMPMRIEEMRDRGQG